jgi:hypothetical protein
MKNAFSLFLPPPDDAGMFRSTTLIQDPVCFADTTRLSVNGA